jgi:hypothetical protein
MGRCETATASIGIKILLSDLILQINENNVTLIKEMLYYGFIEDDNDYFNEIYSRIIGETERTFGKNELPENCLDIKEYLINEFTNNGSYHKSHGESIVKPTLDKGCLFDKYLLVPVKRLLSIDRWGYDRDETNSISTPIDFDLSINTDKYKEIEKTEIVLILGQHAG